MGLFCAAHDLNGYFPKYEVEALSGLKKWFDLNLESPVDRCHRVGGVVERVLGFELRVSD